MADADYIDASSFWDTAAAPQAAPQAPAVDQGMAPLAGAAADAGDLRAPVERTADDVLQPIPFPEPQNFEQFGENAQVDWDNLKQGVGAAGAVLMDRVGDQWQGHAPLIRGSDFQQMPALIGGVVENYWKDWAEPIARKAFAPPNIARGEITSGNLPGAIINQAAHNFANKPLTTFLDTAPVVGKGLPQAAKLAQTAGKVAAGTSYGTKAVDMMTTLAEKASPFYHPVVDQFQKSAAIGKTTVTWSRRFMDEATRMYSDLKDLYDQIPQAARGQVIEAAEVRNGIGEHLATIRNDPRVLAFVEKSRELDDHLAQSLVANKAMTRFERLAGQYGPFAMHHFKLSSASELTFSHLRQAKAILDKEGITPAHFAIMREGRLQNALKIKSGLFRGRRASDALPKSFDQALDPKRVPILEKQIAGLQKLIEDPKTPVDQLKGYQKQLADHQKTLDKLNERKPEFLRSRKSGARPPHVVSPDKLKAIEDLEQKIARENPTNIYAMKYLQGQLAKLKAEAAASEVNDAFKVAVAQKLEAMQYLWTADYLQEILSNPLFKGAEAGTGKTAFQVHDFFNKLGAAQGIAPGQMQQFLKANNLPSEVYLPTLAAIKLERVVNNLIGGESSLTGPLADAHRFVRTVGDITEPISNIQKTAQLGLNPGWAIYQQVQNLMLDAIATLEGPQHWGSAIMAAFLAFDKDVQKALPAWWKTDFADSTLATTTMPNPALLQGAANAGTLQMITKSAGDAAKGVQWLMSKNFELASRGDNAFRSHVGVYNMIKGAPIPLRDAFNLKAWKDNALTLLKDEARVADATKELELWMGKYDSLTNAQRRILRAQLPYANWLMHAAGVFAAMPIKRPFKSAFLNRFLRQAAEVSQDPHVLSQSNLEKGGVQTGRKGPNEGDEVIFGSSLSLPFATPMELAEQIRALAGTVSTDTTGMQQLNALYGIHTNLTGRNERTGKDFVPPEAIKVGGQAYINGKKVEGAKPELGHILGRNLFSSQEGQLRQALAYPNMPSDFTSAFGAHPKRQYEGEAIGGRRLRPPLKQYDAHILMLHNLLKTKPVEQTISKSKERKIERFQNKKLKRQERRRGGVTEEPTSIQRLFNPE